MIVDLRGTRIYYRVYGSGCRTVLMFHGWAMSGASWHHLAERFSPRDWQVIAPDLRGFGQSDKPNAGYGIDDYLRDAVRLLRTLNVRRVDVIGHSFGGTGGLYLALRIPHLVHRLVLLSTIPGARNSSIDPRIRRQFARIVQLVERVPDGSLPTLLMRLWRQSFAMPPTQDAVEFQKQATETAERHAILHTLETILTTDISPWLSRHRVPTLILRGERDPLLGSGPDGLESLAGAARVVIPQAGHYPQLENLDAVWWHIDRFLAG
ncbi:MAG: alpha/beta hydrolase [Firmicutes bacterium]|nr:alpha/beta hydrolase [Bacillota bacterium]